MRANELMIGDIVSVNNTPLKIAALGTAKAGFIDAKGYMFYHYYDNIAPIPLTAEILESNGFGKVLDEYGMECYRYYNGGGDGYIKISLYNGGACDWIVEIVNYDKFNDNEIVYNNSFVFLKVHELQHALRLCGIEKDIEI